jgi:hypothetical protein
MFWFGSSSCDTDDLCAAVDPNAPSSVSISLSLSPFIITFFGVSALVLRRVFPLLSRVHDARDGEDHFLPSHAPPSLRQAHAEHGSKSWRRRIAAIAFSTCVGLSTVLAQLILCEISDLVSPAARTAALKLTVPTLLFLLVVLIPFLELQSIITGWGWTFQRTSKGRIPRFPWLLQLAGFGGWIFMFWSLGKVMPLTDPMYPEISMSRANEPSAGIFSTDNMTRACLERIGVVGISLMALLSGFASVSSPWHTFGAQLSSSRKRPVTDADVSRKQSGLDATNEMLVTKRHKLQALERKASEAHSTSSAKAGFMGKMLGSIRGMGHDETEMRALRLEITGLETMEANLSSNIAFMRNRQAATARAATPMGRLLAVPSYIFSIYCLYRILATSITTFRRFYYPTASFSSSDPINRFLGLIAKHWDPKLDQLAWARQISFLLSGVILAASANSVLQTFHLFAKWMPGLLYQAQANLALLIGQIAATYVISATLLLRSNLPHEVSSAVGDALQIALEPVFVDRWFEGWFLLASAATATGIWVGRKLASHSDWDEWDDYAGEEMAQKRS